MLYNTLIECCTYGSSSSTGDLAAAVIEAVGFVGVTLLQHSHDDTMFGGSSSSGSASDSSLGLGCSCLGMLLSCVAALWRDSGSSSSSSGMQVVVSNVIQQLPPSCRDLVLLQELAFSQVGGCGYGRGGCQLTSCITLHHTASHMLDSKTGNPFGGTRGL